LLLPTASRLIQKFAINTEDPGTVNYQQQLEHMMKQAASDRAIRQMDATRNPLQQTEAVGQIVKQLQLAVPELVVGSTTVLKTISKLVSKTTAVD